MSTPLTLKGLTIANYWPVGYPDYSVAGVIERAYLDQGGNIGIRGAVTTDEGGWRDHFAGAALSADWTQAVGGTGSVTVAASQLTVAGGTTNGTTTYVSRRADFLPLTMNVYTVETTRVPAAGTNVNNDFFFGLYSDPNPALATEYIEWRWPGLAAGGGAGRTTFTLVTQAHAGAGGSQTVAGVTMISSATANWRTLALDAGSVVYRDNSAQALPTPTVRDTRSLALPGLYTVLYFAAGFRVNAAGTVGWSVSMDTVFLKNLDRLSTDAAF